ncbi:MAG: TIGR02466 family protein [Salinisphaera sp.]|jgi:uncharacterized protein (TIGR02466 family)|nr:TIGR02466 family protein [Salinisphaera sp.]
MEEQGKGYTNLDLDVQVGHFFATPVAVTMLAGAQERNAELKRCILAEREREASATASNLGGWHSARPSHLWAGSRMEEILAAARHVATQLTRDRSGQSVDIDWSCRAWANVNAYGHANEFHYHPGVFWSGTYYVDDGGRLEDSTLGGEFEIMDPRGPSVAMYEPSLVFPDGSGSSGGSTVRFTPRPGMLTMFPGWLQHQVRPYLGSAERISIAFNLSVTSPPR